MKEQLHPERKVRLYTQWGTIPNVRSGKVIRAYNDAVLIYDEEHRIQYLIPYSAICEVILDEQ